MVNGGEFKAEAPIIFFDSCTLNQKKKEGIETLLLILVMQHQIQVIVVQLWGLVYSL
jgi:hypothetical protein